MKFLPVLSDVFIVDYYFYLGHLFKTNVTDWALHTPIRNSGFCRYHTFVSEIDQYRMNPVRQYGIVSMLFSLAVKLVQLGLHYGDSVFPGGQLSCS